LICKQNKKYFVNEMNEGYYNGNAATNNYILASKCSRNLNRHCYGTNNMCRQPQTSFFGINILFTAWNHCFATFRAILGTEWTTVITHPTHIPQNRWPRAGSSTSSDWTSVNIQPIHIPQDQSRQLVLQRVATGLLSSSDPLTFDKIKGRNMAVVMAAKWEPELTSRSRDVNKAGGFRVLKG
jgi:hypothetical protein